MPDIEVGNTQPITISAYSTTEVDVLFNSEKMIPPAVFIDTQANTDTLILSSVKYVTTTDAMVLLKNDSSVDVSNVTFDYLIVSPR